MRVNPMLVRAYAATLLITLSLGMAAARPRPSAEFSNIGIHNFGRVNANYYRGAQPKDQDYADLAALGVKTVIDLTSGGRADEEMMVENAGMKFYRIPLTTDSAPSEQAVAEFLTIVNNPANQPVYVHCQGGRHRTGVMTAAYRMTHDSWTPDRAYAEMKEYEFENGLFGHAALKHFVYDYYAGLDRSHIASERSVAAGASK